MKYTKLKILGKKLKGLGILELLLVIAIMSAIVLIAVRYYDSANSSQLLNDAVNQVSAVRSAVSNYHTDFSTAGNTTLPNISTLVNSGYLPSNYGDGQTANPWGGPINVGGVPSKAGSGGKPTANSSCTVTTVSVQPNFSVCMSGIPTLSICQQLSVRLNKSLSPAMNEGATCGTASPTSGGGTDSPTAATATLTVYYLL